MELVTSLFVIAAILIPVFLYYSSYSKQKRFAQEIDKMPGPGSLPLVGSAYLVFNIKRTELWKLFDEITNKYWPRFRTWNGNVAEVHLMEANDIEVVLRSSVNITKGYVYDFLRPWLGTGLLTSTGQKWHAHRKLITPTFHFKILENFQEVFVEKSQILVNKLEKEVGNTKGFDVYPYITHCALDIICETAMGTEINSQSEGSSTYISAVYDMSELVVKRLLTPWLHPDFLYFLTADGKRHKECTEILHGLTNKVIEERRQRRKQSTKNNKVESDELGRKHRVAFLDLLLDAADGGAALSNEDIREEVDTFMFEGHDTTSAGMCWVLFLLGNHFDIQDLVFEELESIFKGSSREPNTQDLAEMKYLERVIKESLRLYPSVPIILRFLTEDIKLGEQIVPAGAHINIQIYHTHRNPKYFPDPEKFDPDNFLPDKVQGRHPYAYIPFSAGSRNCIGQKFALNEEKTVLSSVLRKYRVRALHTPSEITLLGEIVLRPAHGLHLVIERR